MKLHKRSSSGDHLTQRLTGSEGDRSILVSGSGSIGRRHLRNLRALGIERLSVCDPDSERLSPIVDELNVIPFSNFDRALEATDPDIVFVCSPPASHVSQALAAVQIGSHVFVEKPLSHSLDGLDELMAESERNQVVVQVGYNLRFHPGLTKLKALVEEQAVGKILCARAEFGQYLPDWRPWQDYRQSYTARRELGGGIILDASHELDYLLWIMGKPCEVMCMAGKISDLQMNVEDTANIVLRFPDSTLADVHVDCVQRFYSRSCKLVAERGTLDWDYSRNSLRLRRVGETDTTDIDYQFTPNDMYLAEIEHFLDCIKKGTRPLVGLKEGRAVLNLALAAKQSALEGKSIILAAN